MTNAAARGGQEWLESSSAGYFLPPASLEFQQNSQRRTLSTIRKDLQNEMRSPIIKLLRCITFWLGSTYV